MFLSIFADAQFCMWGGKGVRDSYFKSITLPYRSTKSTQIQL